jgi:DNA mismatch repair ATPase MutS
MYIDDITFNDMDLGGNAKWKGGLIELLNHCFSKNGRGSLRNTVKNSWKSSEEILANRIIIEKMYHNLEEFEDIFANAAVDEVMSYISSRWTVNQTKNKISEKLDSFLISNFHLEMKLQIISGIDNYITFIQSIIKLTDLFERLNLKIDFQIERLIAIYETCISALNQPNKFSILLKADKNIRESCNKELLNVIETFVKYEVLYSLSKASKINQWSFPEIGSSYLSFEDLRHPLIQDVYGNSVKFSNSTTMCLLTGANMSGKTTFVKACIISVHLAHLGCAVPAKSAKIPLYDSIYTYMNIESDILAGKSYYLNEVLRIKELAIRLNRGESVFAVLDEPFKGTNLLDAQEALEVVISKLVCIKKSNFILTSHLTHTIELCSSRFGIPCYCFTVDGDSFDLKATFKLQEGISKQRTGMKLLYSENVIDLLDDSISAKW